MPVIVLAGEEDFELYRHLEGLKTKLLDPAWASFNYARHDNPSSQEVIDLASALPFGPGNKVIVLDRIDWFAKKRTAKGDDAAGGAKKAAKGTGKGAGKTAGKAAAKDAVDEDVLAEALGGTHPSTYLIFVSTSNFDNSLRLSKLVAKIATLTEFPKAKVWAGSANATLENWCRKEAKHFNATIDDDAVNYLIDGLDANLRQISSELYKASIYVLPASHITLNHVKNLSPHHSGIFALADLWLSGRVAEAYVALKELQTKQNNMATVATLQTFISKWVEIKALCQYHNEKAPAGPGVQRRELPESDLVKKIAPELKIHPFVLEKDMKRLRSVSLDFLIAKRLQLTDLEHLVKIGQMPDTHALELFFARQAKVPAKK
jgi:DNA polymerase III delta subunit